MCAQPVTGLSNAASVIPLANVAKGIPGDKTKESETKKAIEMTTKIAGDAMAQSGAAVASNPPKPAKPHVWKVILNFISIPLKYIADIFSAIKIFFDDDDMFNIPPALTQAQVNDKELADNSIQVKQWTTDIEALELKAQKVKQSIQTCDTSTTQNFLDWVQIFDTYSSTDSPLYQTITQKCYDLDRQIAGLKKPISDKSNGTQPPLDPALQKHCADLQKQVLEYRTLETRLVNFMTTQGDEIQKQWKDTFDKESVKIVKAFAQIQQVTLTTLQAVNPPVTDHKDIAICRDYMKLFQVLEKHGLTVKLDQQGIRAQHDKVHQDITKLARALSATLDLPLDNIGNTCWMSSAIQALRKSPTLLAMIKAPLTQLPGEGPARWNDRKLMHAALNAVFDAMEYGGDVRQALVNLEGQMLALSYDFKKYPNKDNLVPSDLSDRAMKGHQKDVAIALEFFLNVIDYKMTSNMKNIRNGVMERDTPEPPTSCLSLALHPHKMFKELVEREAWQEADIKGNGKNGKLRQERRFTALPPILVTSLKRFAIDQKKIEDLDLVAGRMAFAFPEFYGSPCIESASEALLGYTRNQAMSKISSAIQLKAGEILDLSNSFLTADLSPADRQRAKWRLVSVIHHDGGSLTRGHYTACGLKPDGKWCALDDAHKQNPVQDLSAKAIDQQVESGYAFIWELFQGNVKEEHEKKEEAEAAPVASQPKPIVPPKPLV